MEEMDGEHPSSEFRSFHAVGLAQEPAHMGEVGGPDEGDEEPGASRLGQGPPARHQHGGRKARESTLGSYFHRQGPHGAPSIRPEGEEEERCHTGEGDQESGARQQEGHRGETCGQPPEHQERPELGLISLTIDHAPKSGTGKETGEGRQTQAECNPAGVEQEPQDQRKPEHEPTAVLGRKEVFHRREESGHFGIQGPK